jgi:hypothetical protein
MEEEKQDGKNQKFGFVAAKMWLHTPSGRFRVR